MKFRIEQRESKNVIEKRRADERKTVVKFKKYIETYEKMKRNVL